MVFEAVKRNTQIRQLAQHLRVARQRLRLVVMVGEHRLHTELFGQLNNAGCRLAVSDQQAAFGVGGLFAPLAVQRGHRRMDKTHPPVMRGQIFQ